MMERHNRKSHLAPQLSPSTQAFLRKEATASPSRESLASTASTATAKTPTSSEIPIANDDQRPLPTSTSEPPMSSRITDVNGNGGIYPEQPAAYDTPSYPPRTSSSLSQTSGRSRPTGSYDGYPGYPSDGGSFNHTLPIRPAPPTGPLPERPRSKYGNASTPRPSTANGPQYPYSENPQQK